MWVWKDVIEKNYILYAVAGILLWGVISEALISLRYKKLIKESENMSLTKMKLLKQMKLKFENSFKLHMGINNSSVFIDKYLFHNKYLGIHLLSWWRIPIIMFLLSAIITAFVLVYGIGAKIAVATLTKYAVLCLIGGITLFLLWVMMDSKHKIKLLKTNIMDFFENSLAYRLSTECALTQTLSKSGNQTQVHPNKECLSKNDEEGIYNKKELQEEIRSMKQQINCIEKERDGKSSNQLQDEEIFEDIIKQYLS